MASPNQHQRTSWNQGNKPWARHRGDNFRRGYKHSAETRALLSQRQRERWAQRSGGRVLVELNCPVCAKPFLRTQAQLDRIRYAACCSRECKGAATSLGIIKHIVVRPYQKRAA
jgi:hypothetical protein